MNEQLLQIMLQSTGAKSANKEQIIQSLWSGYGEVARYKLEGGICESIVVKHVTLPDTVTHPRGWNTDLSHLRKIRSYQVECAWYEHYAPSCDPASRVAKCFGSSSTENEYLMLLEDLDANGFPLRKKQASIEDMKACLNWLAQFHAQFIYDTSKVSNKAFKGLWDVGCYWHLDTRPDELEALSDLELKHAAVTIDRILKTCRYQSIVHGDAKLANFCFSNDSQQVSAVDFQYVGKGCGMKDVAYFIGSCLDSDGCEKHASRLLDFYFQYLEKALAQGQSNISFNLLEKEWRSMYAVAWTDFQRFLKGWSPGHWKIHKYSEEMTKQVLNQI